MVDREKFESEVDYTTVLDNFEGPLDLLLYLIKKAEVEIKDVFVSQVTEQFLAYMNGLKYLDIDKITDYLDIAATIIKIKAQSLVPNPEDEAQAEELEEDKAKIVRALEEYKLIKAETSKLKELETLGYFFKEPDKNVGETKTVYTLENLTLDGLIHAFSTLLIKRESDMAPPAVREIPRDTFTVTEKIQFVLEALENEERIEFSELFTMDYTRAEIITTFQAILELLKNQLILAKQDSAFGEMFLSLNPDHKEATLGKIDKYD